jgi:hypothetical protein
MELVLTQQDAEPLPEPQLVPYICKNEGILNSAYKRRTQRNFFNSHPKSIFGIKQRVKSKRYQITSSIDTALKVSVFVTALIFIL